MEKKVLIVGEPDVLKEELAALLSRSGIVVVKAPTAEEAHELQRSGEHGLIISDLDAPEMGGDRLCSLLREEENTRRVYFLMICSNLPPELQRCGRCGANGYVPRVTSPARIAERVQLILAPPMQRATRVLVKATVEGTFKSDPFYGVSNNVSVSGILLETDKTLARADVIQCSFFLPDSVRIEVACMVVRVEKGEGYHHRYGLQFEGLDPESKVALQEFVKKQRAQGNFM